MTEYSFKSPIGGAPVYHYEEVSSTMTTSRDLVRAGASSGTIVVADFQHEGRGRLPGRRWISAPGQSLMFTLALREERPEGMPLRAGLAVAMALESVCGLSPEIKWPNDIMVADRKICGILCEYTHPWLFVGVGLNLAQREYPEELARTATSVLRERGSLEGPCGDRKVLLTRIVADLAPSRRHDSPQWVSMVNDRLWRRDSGVEVSTPDGARTSGTVLRIEDDGALVVDCAGVERKFLAGELGASANTRRIP